MAEMIEEDFQVELNQLLKLYRSGKLFKLNESPLLQSPLFRDTLLTESTNSIALNRDVTEAILRWGVEKLKPSGQQDWHATFWRHYNILHTFYLESLPVATLAEKMGIAEQTFYEWRTAALHVFGHLLYQECYHPLDLFGRQQSLLKLQYQHLAEAERQHLNLVAVSTDPLPLRPLFKATEIDIFYQLEEHHFVQVKNSTHVDQSPLLRQHLQQLITEEARLLAHTQLFERYSQQKMLHETILHAYLSHQYATVASLCIAEEETILQVGDVQSLHQLMGEMVNLGAQQARVNSNQWAQFLLVAAKTAAWVEALDLALLYSRQALAAPDITIKIQAYYQRAKLLSRVNLDECLSHYAVCLDLIQRSAHLQQETDPELHRLTTKMFIDRAWIYIQERPDYTQADKDLTQAESFIPVEDSALWCDIYNARAGLISRSQSAAPAIPFRLKALTAAEESGDIERMTKMAYNLGTGYLFTGDYENGRSYLDKSRDWAVQSGNLQTLGLAHKGLGSCSFFTEAYDDAILHYEKAYEIWIQTHNKNWQTYISYDLVEAYATVGQFNKAREQLKSGKQLAIELGNERILAELNDLTKQFPALNHSLSSRQTEVLTFIDNHGSINRQSYIELTGVAKSQAYRDLEELCQLGLIVRVGKGRGTRYIQN